MMRFWGICPRLLILGAGLAGCLVAQQAPLAISTQTLAVAVAGVPYSFSLTATGGAPPYNWISVNVLPAGLSLSPNGTISGVTTTTGSFNLTFRVVDSAQAVVTKPLTLTVNSPTV